MPPGRRSMADDGSIGQAAQVASARAQLKDDGWCVVPGVLDAARTTEVLDRLWAAARAFESMGESTHMPMLDPNSSNVRVFYLLELDAVFRELIQHPLAVELVR